MVTYDGSGKAEGVKIYINGEPQQTTIVVNQFARHDAHQRAVENRPAEHGQSRSTAPGSKTCGLYGRIACRPTKPRQLAKATRAACLAAMPAAKRTKAGSRRIVRMVARQRWTRRSQELVAQRLAA